MHASSNGSEAGAGWSLLEAAPDAMLVVGNQGRIEFLNAQTERMFGYLRAELLGEPLEKLLPARCRNRHAHYVSTFLAAPRARPMGDGRELYGQHQDGHEFPVEISLSPVNVSGAPLVIAAIRDITARKQVEEDLRRSREDLEITLQSIGDGVIVTGLDGRVVRINPTAQELTGWTAEAAVGQALEKVFPIFDEATRAPLENPVRKVLECGRTVDLANHTLLRARDGFERPISDSGAPVRDQSGRVRGVVLVFRDQTEEAAAERRIRQSEETLRELLCNIPDFILTLDAQGVVQFVNHGGPPLGREGVIGQSWLAYVSPDQHAVPQSALQQVLATGEPVTYEVTTTGTDGSQIWSAHHIGPIRHEGNIVGAVVVARDVTEKRRIEAQLISSERMASMGMLAAGIAHEINNPLAAIVGNLELASSELSALAEERSLPTALLEELRDAADAAGRVRSIVRDLRIFSRAEEELVSAVDVRQVLESTLRMAWNEVRHRARLVTSYEDVPPVAANESRLGQVFLNLILNAAQAIPEGHADSNQIRVSTGLDAKGDVCIDFADTGDGMSAEVRRRAFDPFFTTKPAGIGTGLGLAICARIVSSFGGSIDVESTLGAGSRFRVRLPASERATATLEPCRDAPTVARRGRVLVIDDEALMGVVIRRALEPRHEVLVCSRAQEALERLVAGEHFDVILCDIMMPELTGADFYQALQQRAPQLVERIVFVTGGAFTAVASEFLERSTNPRVDKPFDLAALRALVDERIQRLEAPAANPSTQT